MRVFISFTAVDKPKAIEIAEKLRGDDWQVFVGAGGESLPPGGAYHDRIKAEIAECDVFIFLVSPTSIEPGRFTHDELGWVRARWPNPKNRVLPVMVASAPFADIPAYLTQTVTVLEPPGNVPTAVLEAVRGMVTELERERLELERQRIELLRQRRIATAKKVTVTLVAATAVVTGIWWGTKTSRCCGSDLDAGIGHDARAETIEGGLEGDGRASDAAAERPGHPRRRLDCFLDRATGKRCPARTTSCPDPALLEGDDFKHWKKDHKDCATITLCSCLQH